MSRLDDLPPDQRAALSLLLRQRKSYDEVAGLLRIDARAVHDRAHAALTVLAARLARELPSTRREEIGDYLLGQQDDLAARLRTRAFLESSPRACAWALALSAELAPLASAPLPAIPDPAPPAPAPGARGSASRPSSSAASPPQARESASPTAPVPASLPSRLDPSGSLPSSRLGGALLLAALAAVIVVAVLLLAGGGGARKAPRSSAATPASATGTTGTTAKASAPTEDKRISLTSPDRTSKALGAAEVLSEGAKYAFYLAAEHVPPSKGFFYAVWLSNSPRSFEALGKSPAVGADGKLQGGALLPPDAAKFHTLLLTRETNPRPTRPGPTVLTGAFALH